MHSTVKIASLLALWLWAAPVLARDSTEPTLTPAVDEVAELSERLLPEFMPCVVADVRYACYTAEQQVQLNRLEAQTRTWWRQASILEQLYLDQIEMVLNLNEQLIETRAIVTAERARNEVLTAQVMDEIAKKNQYRAEADSTDWWPLLVGGTLALLAAGVAIGVGVSAANTSP